jgi:hypothetical protein
MRIFLDEAGPFLPPTSTASSYSLVLALVVPHSCEKELFYEFLRLRDSWPKQQIEIKGSTLNEALAAQVIELLASFDVVVDFIAVDMTLVVVRQSQPGWLSRLGPEAAAPPFPRTVVEVWDELMSSAKSMILDQPSTPRVAGS